MRVRKKQLRGTATQIIHTLANKPRFDRTLSLPIGTRCWLCGGLTTRGLIACKWQGAQFTDQNKSRCYDSDYVCEACAWACSWVQPPGHPPPEPGKRGCNLRLYSHFWDEHTGYEYHNKAEKPAIREWLRRSHNGRWFASIADSGQKHALPWTPINYSNQFNGRVYFEVGTVNIGSFQLIDDITNLLNGGVTKIEIARGEYSPRSWQAAPEEIRSFELDHQGERGGRWYELAGWLSQRDDEEYERRRES